MWWGWQEWVQWRGWAGAGETLMLIRVPLRYSILASPVTGDQKLQVASLAASGARVRRSILRQIQETDHGITMDNTYVNHEILSKRWPAVKCQVHGAHYHTTLCNKY